MIFSSTVVILGQLILSAIDCVILICVFVLVNELYQDELNKFPSFPYDLLIQFFEKSSDFGLVCFIDSLKIWLIEKTDSVTCVLWLVIIVAIHIVCEKAAVSSWLETLLYFLGKQSILRIIGIAAVYVLYHYYDQIIKCGSIAFYISPRNDETIIKNLGFVAFMLVLYLTFYDASEHTRWIRKWFKVLKLREPQKRRKSKKPRQRRRNQLNHAIEISSDNILSIEDYEPLPSQLYQDGEVHFEDSNHLEGISESVLTADLLPLEPPATVGQQVLNVSMDVDEAPSLRGLASSQLNYFCDPFRSTDSESFDDINISVISFHNLSIDRASSRQFILATSEDEEILHLAKESINETIKVLSSDSTSLTAGEALSYGGSNDMRRDEFKPVYRSQALGIADIYGKSYSSSSLEVECNPGSISLWSGLRIGADIIGAVELETLSLSDSSRWSPCTATESENDRFFVDADDSSSVETEINPLVAPIDKRTKPFLTSDLAEYSRRLHVEFVLKQLCESVELRVGFDNSTCQSAFQSIVDVSPMSSPFLRSRESSSSVSSNFGGANESSPNKSIHFLFSNEDISNDDEDPASPFSWSQQMYEIIIDEGANAIEDFRYSVDCRDEPEVTELESAQNNDDSSIKNLINDLSFRTQSFYEQENSLSLAIEDEALSIIGEYETPISHGQLLERDRKRPSLDSLSNNGFISLSKYFDYRYEESREGSLDDSDMSCLNEVHELFENVRDNVCRNLFSEDDTYDPDNDIDCEITPRISRRVVDLSHLRDTATKHDKIINACDDFRRDPSFSPSFYFETTLMEVEGSPPSSFRSSPQLLEEVLVDIHEETPTRFTALVEYNEFEVEYELTPRLSFWNVGSESFDWDCDGDEAESLSSLSEEEEVVSPTKSTHGDNEFFSEFVSLSYYFDLSAEDAISQSQQVVDSCGNENRLTAAELKSVSSSPESCCDSEMTPRLFRRFTLVCESPLSADEDQPDYTSASNYFDYNSDDHSFSSDRTTERIVMVVDREDHSKSDFEKFFWKELVIIDEDVSASELTPRLYKPSYTCQDFDYSQDVDNCISDEMDDIGELKHSYDFMDPTSYETSDDCISVYKTSPSSNLLRDFQSDGRLNCSSMSQSQSHLSSWTMSSSCDLEDKPSKEMTLMERAKSYLSPSSLRKLSPEKAFKQLKKRFRRRKSSAEEIDPTMPAGERRRLKILDTVPSMSVLLRSIRDEKR